MSIYFDKRAIFYFPILKYPLKFAQTLKILITETIHPTLEQQLSEQNWVCTHLPATTYEEVSQIIEEYDGLVVRSSIRVDSALLEKAVRLRFVGRVGSGMELIDTAFAQQRHIVCFNSPEGNRDSVAEHTIGMLLALLHNITKSHAEMQQGIWQRNLNAGTELMQHTLGIIGYGNMGSAVAQRLSSFGITLLGYDKYKVGFATPFLAEVDMATIFGRASIVSFHLPLNTETHHIVNRDFIDRFENDFYLVNTSRGGIVDTAALLDGLHSGKVKGACLDVFENEKPATFSALEQEQMDSLRKLPNVVLTPHLAGITQNSSFKIADVLAKKIIQHFAQ